MATLEKDLNKNVTAEQMTTFESGNEMAAMAAAQINYHIMGYFPITPSTEVAQYLDQMKTRGEHDIQLIAADGEHGSAGICYGAALQVHVCLMLLVPMVSCICLNSFLFNQVHVSRWL